MSERDAGISAEPCGEERTAAIRTPPGELALPGFDRGWVVPDGRSPAFLSYVEPDSSVVNWSAELEHLHEESSRTHFLDRWTRGAIIERIGLVPSSPTIVDVGCSTGYLLEDVHLTHPTATLIGVDLIPAGLEKAHRLVASARLLHADACDLPIADGTVDAIVSANLLEHVPNDRRALQEFARVLRPGARAVMVVPAGARTYDYYDRFLGHERRYAKRELATKCVAAGLEVLEDAYIGSLLYPAFWLVKRRNRRGGSGLHGKALERRVAADIQRTNNSRVGDLAWRFERTLINRGMRLPFGIRSLVVARRARPTL